MYNIILNGSNNHWAARIQTKAKTCYNWNRLPFLLLLVLDCAQFCVTDFFERHTKLKFRMFYSHYLKFCLIWMASVRSWSKILHINPQVIQSGGPRTTPSGYPGGPIVPSGQPLSPPHHQTSNQRPVSHHGSGASAGDPPTTINFLAVGATS